MKTNVIVILATFILLELNLFFDTKVYATNDTVLTNQAESQLVKLKEKEQNSFKHYMETYPSKTYAIVAYLLHKVQIYSIPLCFLSILIGYLFKEILGIKHFESEDKGLALMVIMITLFVICQILPVIFSVVVKYAME